MYKVDTTPFGLYVTLSGTVSLEDLQQALNECQRIWPPERGPRCSIIDIRSLVIPDHQVLKFITSTFYPARRQGLTKVALIIDSPVIKARTKQMLFETGTTDIVRCIDALKVTDWYRNVSIGSSTESSRPTRPLNHCVRSSKRTDRSLTNGNYSPSN
jgi:hypothetical protein